MTVMSFVVVTPRTAKSFEMAAMLLKEEEVCYKMVYYTLYSQSSEIAFRKLEFKQTKNRHL